MNAFMTTIARIMAYVGGLVLTALIAVTTLSVIGRTLNTLGYSGYFKGRELFVSVTDFLQSFGPINGDFEIVEAGVAFAIMACLPWCQLQRGHAKVELFTSFLPGKSNRILALIWEALFAVILIVIAWRLFVGTSDKMRYGETTFMLQFPIWWGYAACAFAAAIACVVALYSVWLHLNEVLVPDADQDVGMEANQ